MLARRPHWAALDGVRAVAVSAVVLLHAGVRVKGGGYGVDIFFALSGFLITGILWDEVQQSGKVDRKNFYLRRALRLFPALLLCCILTTIVDVSVDRGGGHLEALIFVLLYVANWYVAADGQALGFFGQTWSLAIEEQFYLVWPFVIVALRRSHRPVLWLLVIAAASWIAWAVAHIAFGDRADLFTTSRVQELAIGGAAALAMRNGWRPSAGLTWFAAAVLGVLLVADLPTGLRSPVGFPLVAVATSLVLVHVVAAPGGAMARMLAVKPMVGLGRISYGVYLYHYPILLGMAAQGVAHRVIVGAGIALTLLVATASWFLVERPINRRKDLLPRNGVLRSGTEQATATP